MGEIITAIGAIALVVLFVTTFWKGFIVLGFAIILFLILYSKYLPNNGVYGLHYSSTSYCGNENSSSSCSSSRNVGHYKKSKYGLVDATAYDGKIFDGYYSPNTYSFTIIDAVYKSGEVYRGTTTGLMGTVIGRYKDGRIYVGNDIWNKNEIAEYKDGTVFIRGIANNIIGYYDGDDEAGIAAATYYLTK